MKWAFPGPLAVVTCSSSFRPQGLGHLAATGWFLPSIQIRTEIDNFGIRIYQFPDCDSDEDEDFKLQDQALKVRRKRGTLRWSLLLT